MRISINTSEKEIDKIMQILSTHLEFIKKDFPGYKKSIKALDSFTAKLFKSRMANDKKFKAQVDEYRRKKELEAAEKVIENFHNQNQEVVK